MIAYTPPVIRDVLGRSFTFSSPPRRIVSLVPSLTETLFELGAGSEVVGVTDYCIFPPSLPLPRLGGTKNPRVCAIRALEPDLVHMNLEENRPQHATEIETFAPVFVSEPKNVDDVDALFTTLAAIHQRDPEPLRAALRHVREVMPRRAFTFAVAIWKNPWMWCGGDTYVSSLVEAAGGVNVLRDRTRYPTLEPHEIRADVIFLPDEPYVFTAADAREITHAKVIGPFPGHLFTWHGSRTILGLRFLRQTLEAPPFARS
jgi:ABC-type Fe3+-hydroxamate transport system substrate-binding protein